MIGSFPRNALANRQNLAQGQIGTHSAFARNAGLRHTEPRARTLPVPARFCLDCYPSRLGRRGQRLAVPPAFLAAAARCGDGQSLAHRPISPCFTATNQIESASPTTQNRGSHSCVNPLSFLLFCPPPVWPAACSKASMPTAPALAWPLALLPAWRPTTMSRNRPWRAASLALSPATRACATDPRPLTPAFGGRRLTVRAMGATAPMALFRFSDPTKDEAPCSRKS
jgi:hypothetical protein